MYENSESEVRQAVGVTDGFRVGIELYQTSALSLFLFAAVMEVFVEERPGDVEVWSGERMNKS